MSEAEIQERDPRFRRLEMKIGIMVLVAVVGIVVILVFIGKEKDLFAKTFSVYFVSDSGRELTVGMPVKLSGFKIGKVEDMELTEDAAVRVTLEIYSRYQGWLRAGTSAKLVKEGFIGEPFVQMSVDTPDGRMLEDGEMLVFSRRVAIEEVVNEVKPVLLEIKEIIHYANDPEGDIKTMLGNIREVTGEIKDAKEELGEVVRESAALTRAAREMVERVSGQTGPIVDSTARVLENLDGITTRMLPLMDRIDRIASNTEEASTVLPDTARRLADVTENIRIITDTLAAETPRVREILSDAGETITGTKEIVDGAKQSWPVRLLMPAPPEPSLVPLDAISVGGGGEGL
jgi:phospholipid/cholesterol/gamma-HCH transport system substrate-binding protein